MIEAADILVFVDDPGAANYVARLPRALSACGTTACLVARDEGVTQLARLAIPFAALESAVAASDLLSMCRPRLVVVGTSEDPDSMGLDLIKAAQSGGIPAVGVVDGPGNPERRFRGHGRSPRAFEPDRVLVPDQSTRRAFRDLGFAPERVIACGHPHCDRIREDREVLARRGRRDLRATLFPEAPPDRPILLFAAEQDQCLDPSQIRRSPDYSLAGRGRSDRRTDIVLEEVLDAASALRPRPYFVLRLHPKNTVEEFAPYRHEIDAVSREGLATEAVFAADLVVGMTSMLLLEAALLGRPTLSVIPRALERAWLITIGGGVTPALTVREEIAPALEAALRDADSDPTGMDGLVPPGATDRVARILAGLAAPGMLAQA